MEVDLRLAFGGFSKRDDADFMFILRVNKIKTMRLDVGFAFCSRPCEFHAFNVYTYCIVVNGFGLKWLLSWSGCKGELGSVEWWRTWMMG
jgi:hypothetical protein